MTIADDAAALRLAVGRFVRRVRQDASTLPSSQAAALGRLDRDGPQTVADLAAAERVSHQSMARLVQALRDQGLVEPAEAPPGDRRRRPWRPTPLGRALLDEQRSRRVDWLAEAMRRELTAAERRTLVEATALIERLADAPVPRRGDGEPLTARGEPA
jgi:DNA-binding MarR family transcriptional regulator